MATGTSVIPQDPSTFLFRLVSAIATAEGFFTVGSVPDRNNNPGDLRAAPWIDHPVVENGFWVASSRAAGIAGAYHQVTLDIARGCTLRQLIYKWAPPGDGNNSANYLAETGRRIGMAPSDFDRPLWEELDVTRIP